MKRQVLWLLVVAGCSDEAAPSEADAGRIRGSVDATVVVPGADADPPEADAGPPAAPDAAPAGDAGPACTDEQCGPGRICLEGDRCVEGTRCGPNFECPPGRRCAGELCLVDPRATGGLSLEPEALAFTFGEPGDEGLRIATLTNVGENTLEIVEFEFLGAPTFQLAEPVELPLRLVQGQTREVGVVYRADDVQPDEGTLRVHTASGTTAEARLISSAKITGQAAPCLALRPVRLDFGAVARGSSRTLSFHLESCGTVPVNVNAIRRGQGFFGPLADTFQLDGPPPFPVRLEPGQRQEVRVTYTPQRAGLEAGNWDVLSDDRASPQQRVDVSAIATPPPLEDVGLHIRMRWDTDLTDVDMHVLAPGGQPWTCAGDCYFSNPNPDWGVAGMFEDDPFLDLDDVDGFGPENVNIQTPMPGTYRVIAQYWADHGGSPPEVVVEVLSFDQVVASYGPVQLNRSDDEWDVVDIDWPGLALRPLGNAVVNRARGALCGGF